MSFPIVEAFSGEFYIDPEDARTAIISRRMFNLMHLQSAINVDFTGHRRAPSAGVQAGAGAANGVPAHEWPSTRCGAHRARISRHLALKVTASTPLNMPLKRKADSASATDSRCRSIPTGPKASSTSEFRSTAKKDRTNKIEIEPEFRIKSNFSAEKIVRLIVCRTPLIRSSFI